MTKRFIRKTITILLIVLMLSATLMPIASAWRNVPPPHNNPFTDVATNRWYHDYVTWAWVNGIAEGTTTTTFRPGGNITRAQFVALLYRVSGSPAYSPTQRFSDVPTSAWFAPAVEWAARHGVVTGIANTTRFEPNRSITRQEVAAVMHRYFGQATDPTSPPPPNRFLDLNTVNRWARDNVNWAFHAGVLQGAGANGRHIQPLRYATRAEAVAMIRRIVVNRDWVAPELPPEPFLNVPRIANNPLVITTRTEAVEFTGTIIGAHAQSDEFTFNASEQSGLYRLRMIELPVGVTANVRVWHPNYPDNPTYNFNMVNGQVEYIHLSSNAYTIEVRHQVGVGAFELEIYRREDLSAHTQVTDFFESPGQQNTYTFIPQHNGIFRFDFASLPLIAGQISRINLEIIDTRDGGTSVVAPEDFHVLGGASVELERGVRYVVIVSHVSGNAYGLANSYRMRIGSQKPTVTIPRGVTLVNDSIEFIGQINKYSYTPGATGAFDIILQTLPAGTQVVVEVFGPDGPVRSETLRAGQRVSVALHSGLEYEIHIRHSAGQLGAYTFILVR